MPGERILLIDDESDIGDIIDLYMKEEGFPFQQALTGAQALEAVASFSPNLILLDVFLPDIEGYELCKQLRAITDVPIIFLSCKHSEMDKVIGLSVGGDDYVSKPFGTSELIARIKAHLRRSAMLVMKQSASESRSIVSPSLEMKLISHEVFLNGERIELSAKEFELLKYFMSHPNQVLAGELLLRKIWGYDKDMDTKTLQVHIGTLRKKIEADPAKPERIVTLRGVGYKFCEHAKAI